MSRLEPQVSLKGLSKSYGDHIILNNIDLDIYTGDFLCIFGKSGCGKSTLLNIIGTLESYEIGKLRSFTIDDPIKKEKSSMYLRRNRIAYLFQNFALVDKMTVEENMLLATRYNSVKDKKL